MYQIQYWVALASLLVVFPAHASSSLTTVQSRQGTVSSTDIRLQGEKGIQFAEILAQETPMPEPEAEMEPAAPETPTESPIPEATPTPSPTESPDATLQESSDFILNVQGELKDGDPVLASDGSLYHEYTFDGTQGQEVTISLESNEFDTYLAIFTPDNKLLEEHDDISPTNTNSLITVTLPTDGAYRIIVNSYDDQGRGRYQLTVK